MLTRSLIAISLATGVGAIAVINHNQPQKTIGSTRTSNVDEVNASPVRLGRGTVHQLKFTEIECEVDVAETHKNSGDSYSKLGEYEKAIAEYSKAISLKPEYVEAYANRAVIFNRLKQYRQANSDYKKLIDIGGIGSEIYRIRLSETVNLLTDSEQETIKGNKEIADLTKAINNDPQRHFNYSQRAGIYLHLEYYVLALADYNTAISIKPQNPYAYADRGSTYHQLKQYDQALADYNTAISIEPTGFVKYVDYDYIYSRRADLYRDLKQYDKAIADYSQTIAISKMPGASNSSIVPEAYNKRADLYRDLKQYDKAIADYSHTIANYPRDLFGVDTYAYRRRADLYRELKQYDKAIADYSQTIAKYTSDYCINCETRAAVFYDKRAAMYREIEQYDKAIADYAQILAIFPKSADTYKNRGDLYLELGEIRQAKENWQEAAELYQRQNNCEQHRIVQQQLQKKYLWLHLKSFRVTDLLTPIKSSN